MICALGLFSLIIQGLDCWSWGRQCHRPHIVLKDLAIVHYLACAAQHTNHCIAKQNVKYFPGNDRQGGSEGWVGVHGNGRHGKSSSLPQ